MSQSFTIHPFDPEQCNKDLAEINAALGAPKSERELPSKLICISNYYAPVVAHALAQRYKTVTAEMNILKRASARDLMPFERDQLPANLATLSREELVEQIHPWITLQQTIGDLMKQFEFES